MDKIILLVIVGLLIIGAIALNDIFKSQETEITITTPERQSYSSPNQNDSMPDAHNETETSEKPLIPPMNVKEC